MIATDEAIQELSQGDASMVDQARKIVRIVARADERAATAKGLEQTEERLGADLEHVEERLTQKMEASTAQTEAKRTNRICVATGVLAALLSVFEFLV